MERRLAPSQTKLTQENKTKQDLTYKVLKPNTCTNTNKETDWKLEIIEVRDESNSNIEPGPNTNPNTILNEKDVEKIQHHTNLN